MDNTAKGKFSEVRSYLLRELRSGKYGSGDKFVSENRLTQQLGVSKNTVREAVSSLVSEGFFSRVQGSGTYVRELPRNAVKHIDLIVGNPLNRGADDLFIGSLLSGLHQELDPLSWRIRLRTVADIDRPETGIRDHLNHCESGATVLVAGFNATRAATDPLRDAGCRVLSLGRPEDETIPYVHHDHAVAMRAALERLFALGHRRIALVDRRSSHASSYEERLEAYLSTHSEAGIVPDGRIMVSFEGFGMEAGEEAATLLLSRAAPFTAAVIYGDWPALGFRRGMERAGRSIPGHLSLVCYGARLEGLTYIEPRFTEMARAAARMALSDKPVPAVHLMPLQWVDGGSVGPAMENRS